MFESLTRELLDLRSATHGDNPAPFAQLTIECCCSSCGCLFDCG